MALRRRNAARKNRRIIARPEPGPGFRSSIRDLAKYTNGYTLATGIVPALVIMFTFSVLQVELLTAADVPRDIIVAWVTISWMLGGIVGIIMSLYYKTPIAGAWSIPGFIFVGGLLGLGQIELPEVFGAFWMSGALVFLLGITGAIDYVVRIIPPPVMIAMVAGVLIQFPLDMILIAGEETLLVAAGVIGYAIFEYKKGPTRFFPGIAGTILLCAIVAGVTGRLDFSGFEFEFGQAYIHTPVFTLEGFLTISIPLCLMVVGAENMQATAVLKTAGRTPPVNSMTKISGLGGMAAAGLGAENANIAGPTTAAVNSPDAGAFHGRYVAGAVSGVTYVLLAIVGGTVVSLVGVIPEAVATVLLGMLLVRVVSGAIRDAWSERRFSIGAFFAFTIALSDVAFFDIGSPFWSLLGGSVAVVLFELNDYKSHKNGDKPQESESDAQRAENKKKYPEFYHELWNIMIRIS